MPKFFKRNILAEQVPPPPVDNYPQEQASPEVFSNKDKLPEQFIPQHHSFPEQNTNTSTEHSSEEEKLLPSPLDTLELLPAHTPIPPHISTDILVSNSENPRPEIQESVPQTSIPNTIPSTAPIAESKLVETLMTWQAPSRPHRKKDRSFYTTVAILIILIAMIALLAGERMLVAVLFALMFLVYVINFIEPGDIEYRISTQGITIDEHFYHWQELDSFWFNKKDGYTILHVLTQLKFPAVLMVVLSPTVNEDQIKRTVARFLPFHEIAPKSFIDKLAENLQKYFPLENPHK